MPKLYFRYGTMGSAKTLNLLAVAHNYSRQGKNVKIAKPKLDDRFGEEQITSRAGLSKNADYLIDPHSDILKWAMSWGKPVSCVLVDESQFLTEKNIEDLRKLVQVFKVPVICYGLRTNYRTRLFEGSKRLMELADSIEEIKTTCQYCERKATMHLRLGRMEAADPDIILGTEEVFHATCYPCYEERSLSTQTIQEEYAQQEC